MKRSTKALTLLIVMIMLLMSLVACSSQKLKGVSTEILEADLKTLDNYDSVVCYDSNFVYESAYELADYELIKRQTNLESKQDIVYYDIIYKNNYFEVVFHEKLIYNYYDEGGWILDEAILEGRDVTPINGAEEELIYQIWNYEQMYIDALKCDSPENHSGWGQFRENRLDVNTNIIECEFDKENLTTKLYMELECLMSKSTGYLQVNFNEELGWHIYSAIEDNLEDYGIEEDLKFPFIVTDVEHDYSKICGEYYLKTDYTENYIILDIDEEAGIFTKTTKVYSSFGGEPLVDVYTVEFNPITGGLNGTFDLENGTWDTGFGSVYTKIS